METRKSKMRVSGKMFLMPKSALAIFAMAVLITAVLTACSEKPAQVNAKPAPSSVESINADSVITPKPLSIAPALPQEKVVVQPPAAAGSDISSDAILEEGKLIFEKRAGNVGCAYCHGLDGKGKSEFGAPPIRGKTEEEVKAALATRIQMNIVKLNDQEIKAVVAYLKYLEGAKP